MPSSKEEVKLCCKNIVDYYMSVTWNEANLYVLTVKEHQEMLNKMELQKQYIVQAYF